MKTILVTTPQGESLHGYFKENETEIIAAIKSFDERVKDIKLPSIEDCWEGDIEE